MINCLVINKLLNEDNQLKIHFNGNEVNNIFYGRSYDDVLKGRAGNDIYYVDSKDDRVTEKSGEGIDLIYSSVTYTASSYVEDLFLQVHLISMVLVMI